MADCPFHLFKDIVASSYVVFDALLNSEITGDIANYMKLHKCKVGICLQTSDHLMNVSGQLLISLFAKLFSTFIDSIDIIRSDINIYYPFKQK